MEASERLSAKETNGQLNRIKTRNWTMKRSLLVGLLAPVVLAGSINAASDMFLKLDGIKGESSDSVHPETIEIESFSWGTSNTNTAAGGGQGKASFSDIHFVTKLSKASPRLLSACAGGTNILSATLYARNPASTNQEYYQITLENIQISSLKQTGQSAASTNSTDRPTEQVSFAFSKITMSYTGDDGTVTTGTAVKPSTP